MSMDDKKNPWFGPKIDGGRGIGPRTWQGWSISGLMIVTELTTVTVAHHKYPYWFVAKTSGSGFNPATWQGWLATVGPVGVFLLIMASIYYGQRGA